MDNNTLGTRKKRKQQHAGNQTPTQIKQQHKKRRNKKKTQKKTLITQTNIKRNQTP